MPPENDQLPSRGDVLRDIIVFQGKLLLDGLRDVLLSPISILAALFDLLKPGEDHGRSFYAVVKFGRRTEGWINLFEAADRLERGRENAEGVDGWIREVEFLLRDPEKRERMPAKARERLTQLLEKLR